MVLTVSFVLSPVTGLYCHRRSQIITCELDTSVGAPGPHDFSVRASNVRLTRYHVHRIPHPTFVTIAKRPLWVRTRESVELICPTAQAKYIWEGGLDDPNHVESLHENRVLAHAILQA
jgi:hypothetical protein